MSQARVRVLVVDDQRLFAEGVCAILSTLEHVDVVGMAHDGQAALRLSHQHRPDVVLMDLRMPELDGIQATRRLSSELPHIRVVALTTFEDEKTIFQALRAGAVGYLLKDASASEISDAVQHAARGESALATRVATRMVHSIARSEATPPAGPPEFESLTPRERDVVALLGRGASNKAIASSLSLTEGTVKNHVTAIRAKLGGADRLQIAILARQAGLLGE